MTALEKTNGESNQITGVTYRSFIPCNRPLVESSISTTQILCLLLVQSFYSWEDLYVFIRRLNGKKKVLNNFASINALPHLKNFRKSLETCVIRHLTDIQYNQVIICSVCVKLPATCGGLKNISLAVKRKRSNKKPRKTRNG